MAEGEEKMDAEGADAPRPVAPQRTGRLVPILLVVNTVALVAIAALQILALLRPGALRHDTRSDARVEERAPAPEHAPEKRVERKDGQPGPTLRLADFVVHLRDPDTDRYARVSFEMELPDEKAKEAVTARIPLIRDAFLAYLSDRTTEELRGSEAIGHVKSALTQKLGDLAPAAAIRALYITELVVQ